MKNPTTILLTVNDRGSERPIFEDNAGAALMPGHLVAFDASGDLIPHGTADGNAQKLFAIENPYQTPGASDSIETAYTSGALVRYFRAQSGDTVYALLKDEGNVSRGDPLVSEGDGTLDTATIDATVAAGAVVAYADEDVDNTGGSGPVRIRAVVA